MAVPIHPTSKAMQRVRAGAMTVGAGVLSWHYEAVWAFVLLGVFGTLFLLALAWPRGYAPISEGFDRVQRAIRAAITWLILGITFVFVILPMRVLVFRRPWKKRPEAGSPSYWRTVSREVTPEDFDRSY